MKLSLRFLIVFFLIFTVTGHIGFSVSGMHIRDAAGQYDPVHDNEDAEESAEKTKESLKEYWHSVAMYSLPSIISDFISGIPENKNYAWSFYPSIPTPPPDADC